MTLTDLDDEPDRDDLRSAIEDFRPLPFRPAADAAAWLQDAVDEKQSWLVMLGFDPDEPTLLGFFVLRPVTFEVTRTRLAILKGRRGSLQEGVQQGCMIDWIARNQLSGAGFGQSLYDFAVAHALSKDMEAMIVDPADAPTREIWRRKFRFTEFEARAAEGDDHPERMWRPTRPAGNWPS